MPTVTDQARKTADRTQELAADARLHAIETVQAAVRDGALATVGAGDQLVRQLRALSARVRDLDLRTQEGRQELEQRLERMRRGAASEFEQLVARGREVVDGISESRAAERALGQTRTATSQVKAAATSVRKIADVGAAEAFDTAAGLRESAEAGRRQVDVAASQAKAAATSARGAVDETAEAAQSAAERVGTERTEVPLEDLKFAELRELAKQRGIEGRTGMNKAELIAALREG